MQSAWHCTWPLKYLENKHTYARILFINFSSAFNTIHPLRLFRNLQDMNINTSLCLWILDFVKNRSQAVKPINKKYLRPSLPARGCHRDVFCPHYFSFFSQMPSNSHQTVEILKNADDTTILGLITKDNEDGYRWEVERTVSWRKENESVVNRKKMEMIINFGTEQAIKAPLLIDSQPITITDSFKFLGTHNSNNLKWDLSTNSQTKKAQQRLCFFKAAQKNTVRRGLLVQLYTAITQIILFVNYCESGPDQSGLVSFGLALPSLWAIVRGRALDLA